MKRTVLLPLLLMLLSAWLPFHSVKAIEHSDTRDGVYQVELSFLSHETADPESLFIKQATLTVKEDRYTLSIAAKKDHILTQVTAVQQGDKASTWLNRAENLVQFDIKNVEQKVELAGTFRSGKELAARTFSYDMQIQSHSLPAIDFDLPSQSIHAGDDTVHFELLVDGKHSGMNDYVNKVSRVFTRDDRHYVQLEILHPKQVKEFTVEQQGEFVKPQLVIQDQTHVVQFEVEDLQKGQRVRMKVESLDRSFVKEESLHMMFDPKQVASVLGNRPAGSKAVSSLTKRGETASVNKPVAPTVAKKEERTAQSTDKKEQEAELLPPLLEEEQLEFDRAVDEKKEPEQAVVQVASEPEEQAIEEQEEQTIPFDSMKTGVLLLVFLLSGILLVRRLVKRNRVTGTE